jgi:2',3'-cyclic-nucleotide 2'-phosphodiesterase / 3'-nucleotidase
MKLKNTILPLLFLIIILILSCSGEKFKKITIIETTDLHGVIWPYDYVEKTGINSSLASIYSYVKQVRKESDATLLLDNGDNLQGQPTVYYYNFIDTVSPHFLSEVFNFMKYDAASVGNHDIEAGHAVYDRLVNEYNFPLLAANAVDRITGNPYFKPYCIIEKEGIKIAVLGLVTPAIPTWLPEELYKGMEFKDMAETARKWIPIIQKEKPDLIIGLFHSGWDRSREELVEDGSMHENGSAAVAYNVPGFDIIFNGHDHRIANELFVNSAGDTVLVLDGGSKAQTFAQVDVVISSKKVNGRRNRKISGSIINVAELKPDSDYLAKFANFNETVKTYVDQVIATSTRAVSSRDSYFGSSAFIDLIHSIQLEITGADISFAAPLSFDVQINEGPVTVGDMFKLYRFENMLYTMTLSGEEIDKYLEYSYGGWLNIMSSDKDPLLKFRTGKDGNITLTQGKAFLRNQPYNFDSAAGINYTVDVTKPDGNKVTISGFVNGKQFDESKTYKIAVNSYRGTGGGGHFTEGAGIGIEELRKRLVKSTDRDLRYYIMEKIKEKKTLDPLPMNNWRIVPENWVKSAKAREYPLLFGSQD